MVKVLTAGGRGNGIPIGPVYFSRDYVTHGFFTDKTYPQGAVASFYVYINFSADPHTWTCAYPTVSSYLKCPSITSGPSIDAATSAITKNRTLANMVRNQVTLHRSPLRDLIPRSNPTRVQRSTSSMIQREAAIAPGEN
jgi:hypothetical protein